MTVLLLSWTFWLRSVRVLILRKGAGEEVLRGVFSFWFVFGEELLV